jgi:hypothetical protein
VTRPKPFTEKVRRKRRAEQAKAEAGANSRYIAPTAAEIQRDIELAADLTAVLGLPEFSGCASQAELIAKPSKAISDLAGVLGAVRWNWLVRKHMRHDQALPSLGGVQPTHGQMQVTIEAGLKHAEALREWYRSLSPGLLFQETVPMTTPRSSDHIEAMAAHGYPIDSPPLPEDDNMGPALGAVIERLADKLAILAAKYEPRPGRQPGTRSTAQWAARPLIWFLDRHASNAPLAKRRKFLFRCMRAAGIDCPDLDDEPGYFARWFREVEALAQSATAQAPEPCERDEMPAIDAPIKDAP